MWRLVKKTGKVFFIATYIFLLPLFLWQVLLRPLIDEFIPLGPIYTDVSKRIKSPDGTKTAVLIRRNAWDLNFAVKIKEGLKTKTLHWTHDFVPNLAADWNEQIIWSDDSNLIILKVDEQLHKRPESKGLLDDNPWYYWQPSPEKYIWAYDFK